MPEKKIRVAIVGLGFGAEFIPIYQHHPNAEMYAICQRTKKKLDTIGDAFGVEKRYTDYQELLKDPNVDIVAIATPDHHHGYAALDAIAAGKDVYCEKPVTHWRQFELIKKMCEEVKKSGRVFQLGSQGMSCSAWQQARKLIQDGLIGQPILAECGYFRVGTNVCATPLPPSAAERVTIADPATQPAGASAVVDGAVVSTRTVAVRVGSRFPTTSNAAYSIVWVPSAAIATGAVYATMGSPSTEYSMPATPEPVSTAQSETLCEWGAHANKESSAERGAFVSIRTIAVRVDSLLPTPSTDQYSSVLVPSADMETGDVYSVAGPESRRQYVAAVPEPESTAASVTLTGPGAQPLGASSVVVGAVRSMRTVAVLVGSELPAASTDQYFNVVVPSALTKMGSMYALGAAAPTAT